MDVDVRGQTRLQEMRAAQRAVFLGALRDTGNVSAAAARSGLNRQCLYKRYTTDEVFREEWDAALGDFCATVEAEIKRRGVEGVEEPVFYKGEPVGKIRRYSDQCLLALAARHMPEYRRVNRGAGGGEGGGEGEADLITAFAGLVAMGRSGADARAAREEYEKIVSGRGK